VQKPRILTWKQKFWKLNITRGFMDYRITYQMKSGQGEAVKNVYTKHIGKSGDIWLVKEGKFAADNIYVSGGPGSKGFGGATLEFQLVDGTVEKLVGPWHCNAGDLFKDTGVDVRNKHSSRVIIAKDMQYEDNYMNRKVFKDVIVLEEEFVEGSFDRREMYELAQKHANELGQKLYIFKETGGGSCGEWIKPNNQE